MVLGTMVRYVDGFTMPLIHAGALTKYIVFSQVIRNVLPIALFLICWAFIIVIHNRVCSISNRKHLLLIGTWAVYLVGSSKPGPHLRLPTGGVSSGTRVGASVNMLPPVCQMNATIQVTPLKLSPSTVTAASPTASAKRSLMQTDNLDGTRRPKTSDGLVAPPLVVGGTGGNEAWSWNKCKGLVFVTSVLGKSQKNSNISPSRLGESIKIFKHLARNSKWWHVPRACMRHVSS